MAKKKEKSLQERFAPNNRCFGCGPANKKGLRIRSFPLGDEVVCDWKPEKQHEAFEGILNGGICGTLLDCHSNWTAAWHFMKAKGLSKPPVTVTAEFNVKLLKPTPTKRPIRLRAKVIEASENRAVIEANIEADGETTVNCRGIFVAVRPGHPAFNAW